MPKPKVLQPRMKITKLEWDQDNFLAKLSYEYWRNASNIEFIDYFILDFKLVKCTKINNLNDAWHFLDNHRSVITNESDIETETGEFKLWIFWPNRAKKLGINIKKTKKKYKLSDDKICKNCVPVGKRFMLRYEEEIDKGKFKK